jgi:ferredoxin hydrogenase large subunit
MFGAIAKTFGAESLNIKPEFIRVISIMPCSPKKVEASRPEMNSASKYWQYRDGFNRNFQDVDVVITAQELVRLIKLAGIDLYSLPEENPDFLLHAYTVQIQHRGNKLRT